ncbi:alpha-hydroxy-acid oxidizing protein [Sphaerisporangium viridialbum]|uniref:alpha-hydroxy-acid oxidizing protein n=1 Tax=Sphaerisporangium viridialbum TaxID=46189 RepID=UPI003C71E374
MPQLDLRRADRRVPLDPDRLESAAHHGPSLDRPDETGFHRPTTGVAPPVRSACWPDPSAYGLGLAGEAGVRHVIRCLLAELETAMPLTGTTRPTELTPDLLASG